MSNLVRYAERELKIAGLFDKDSDYEGRLAEAVIELVRVFSAQGHSGASAHMTVALFKKVALFESLIPLQGTDDEWNEVSEGIYQNNRCSHVFKENGQAYDIYGKVFREPSGTTYTNRESRVFVTFPYVPKTEIIDVKE